MDGDKPVIRDLQRINGAFGLASLQAPSLRLMPLLLMAGVLERIRMRQAIKSLGGSG